MPVKLRLRRVGAKSQPRYRIVAADSRSPRDGRFIEVIGYYLPTRRPAEISIDERLALKWLAQGAQPTETVGDLLVQQGIMAKFYQSRGKPVPAEAMPGAAEAAAAAEPATLEAAEPAPAPAPVQEQEQEPAPVPEEAAHEGDEGASEA